ncbi:MAG TPA: hypothetical protein VHD91_10120 [Gaiellaceae bacterium]|nr:hypothetical protein [Gaiellaceae bacterium]
MGGSRPWTVGRVASLAVLVGAVLAILTGLTHVGKATQISDCRGDWQAVIGSGDTTGDVAILNNRAVALVSNAANPCLGALLDAKHKRYLAVAPFPTEQAASSYVDALVAAGYVRLYNQHPYVRPEPTTLTPGR